MQAYDEEANIARKGWAMTSFEVITQKTLDFTQNEVKRHAKSIFYLGWALYKATMYKDGFDGSIVVVNGGSKVLKRRAGIVNNFEESLVY